MESNRGTWVLVATFVLAITLTIYPLPPSLMFYRPDWIALFLIYWCVALPHRVGILVAWVLGFFVDAAQGSLLGLNGLLLAFVAYFSVMIHQRMRIFPTWKQALVVSVLIAVKLLLALLIINSVRSIDRGIEYWYPAITSGLLWPLVFTFCRRLRRQFAVK